MTAVETLPAPGAAPPGLAGYLNERLAAGMQLMVAPPPAVPAQNDNADPLVALGTLDFPSFEGLPVPERHFLVKGLVPVGCVTLFTSSGGQGKSTLAMMLGTSAAVGYPWLDIQMAQAPALGLFCEDDRDELRRRQARINTAIGVTLPELGDWHPASRVGQDNALATFQRNGTMQPTPLFETIRAAAKACKARLIILDNIAHIFAGDENNRVQVTTFINLLSGLAFELDAAVLLIGHPPKTDAEFSGSTAWANAVRSRLYLDVQKKDGEQTISLKRSKANYAPDSDETIELIRGEGGVMRRATPFIATYAGKLEADMRRRVCRQQFLKALDQLADQRRNVSDKKRAGNYAPKMMRDAGLCDGVTDRELAVAMNDLLNEGMIRANMTVGKTASRNALIGLARVRPIPDEPA